MAVGRMSAFSSFGRSAHFCDRQLLAISGSWSVQIGCDTRIRLYEQEPEAALASARLGLYVRRWTRWAGVGLGRDEWDRSVPDPL